MREYACTALCGAVVAVLRVFVMNSTPRVFPAASRQVTALDLANAQLIEALYELTAAMEERGDVGGAKRKVMLWEQQVQLASCCRG